MGSRGAPPRPTLPDSLPVLADSTVEALQQQILAQYLSLGYPFASLACFLAGPDSLCVSAVPGRHALLEGVRIEGLERTSPGTLTRYLRLEPGEPYDPESVEKWRERLRRLEFVEWVGDGALCLGPLGNLVVVQDVVEGSSGSIAASLLYGQSGDEGLSGSGLVDFTNLLGTGRELSIEIADSRWGGTNVSGHYLEPWIAGYPLSGEVSLMQEIPDSGWLNREADILLIAEVSEVLSVSAGAGGWRGYGPDGEDSRYNYGLAGMSWSPGRTVPRGWQGLKADLECRLGNVSGEDSSLVLSTAELEARADLFAGAAGLGLGMTCGGAMQGEPPYSLLRRLGGQESLRGYAEDTFRATRYAVLRPEVSFGETATRLYAFCDLSALDTPDGDRYPAGAGGGLRGEAGSWSIDLAVGAPLRGGPARFYVTAVARVL